VYNAEDRILLTAIRSFFCLFLDVLHIDRSPVQAVLPKYLKGSIVLGCYSESEQVKGA